MQVERHDNHAVFQFPDKDGGWALCLIDDAWDEAVALYDQVGHPFHPDKVSEWEATILYDPAVINRIAVGRLLVVAERLEGLKRVVFADFPRAGGSDSLSRVLADEGAPASFAFLIDIHDEQRRREQVVETQVLPLLRRARVPLSRCAYFTQGVPAVTPLERIIKATFLDKPDMVLRDWWQRVLGQIDDEYFTTETTKPGRANWHDPSRLQQALAEEGFGAFVKEQATRDSYGVWRWVYQALSGSRAAADRSQEYAYLCGKAFLKSSPRKSPDGAFPFTALRGLVYGLAQGQLVHNPTGPPRTRGAIVVVAPDTRKVDVIDAPDRPAPPLASDEVSSPIDDIGYYGWYHTGQAPFEQFAAALREWLEKLESDPKGQARLQQADLTADQGACRLRLVFSRPLPRRIFSDDEQGGLVTRAYSALHRCFPGDAIDLHRGPSPPSEGPDGFQEVTFTFKAHRRQAQAGHRQTHGSHSVL